MKTYATMRTNGAELTKAKSKKEAANKLNVSTKEVYIY